MTDHETPLQWDSLWLGANIATMKRGRYSLIERGAIGVRNGHIAWIGAQDELPRGYETKHTYRLEGGLITPGLVDCHTHLIFGGNRANEFEMRLNGASYQDIANAGGGIISSVKATRAASVTELVTMAQPRLASLMADGVTTIEIKSGYGLNLQSEIDMLRAAKALLDTNPIDVKTTCLAAHALPPEFIGRPDDYIDYLCSEVLPKVAQLGLADAVDAFCEGIGFSVEQTERYFKAAQKLDLPVKLHAEQLSALGGSTMAAGFRALSADHLEYVTEEDVKAMAAAGSVAVILPGAFYVLRETQKPPIELFRKHKVPMAIATDANPGTAPVLSLRLMMNMACTLFGMTPEEALAGATLHGAKALGVDHQVGSLEEGKKANFIHWNVSFPGELSYWLGGQLLQRRVYLGEVSE
jgi:imidazolonepropionase